MAEAFTPDQDMVDRYVQRRLSDEETEQFEIWLMEHPEALNELKYGHALRSGIKLLGPDYQHTDAAAARALPNWLGWLVQPVYASAAAAIVLAAVAVPTLISVQLAGDNERLAETVALLSRPNDTLFTLPLGITRGTDDRPDARILLTPSPYVVLLSISVSPWLDEVQRFAVTLRKDGQEIDLPDSPVSAEGHIQLALNSAALSEGLLEIVLRGDEKIVATFKVAVEAGPGPDR